MSREAFKVRVLIVEDQSMLRDALEQVLSHTEDIEVVGSLGTSQYTMTSVGLEPVDVIVTDLVWQGDPRRGLQLIQHTLHLIPQIKVVICSACHDRRVVHQAIAAGVDGYLIKDEMALNDVVHAVRSVHRNVPAYSNTIVKIMTRLLREGTDDADYAQPLNKLTYREREVVALLSQGLSNAEIARHLDVAVETVRAHVSHVLRKLGLSGRYQVREHASVSPWPLSSKETG